MLLCYNAFCVWLFCLSKIQNECSVMRISPALMAAFLLCAYLLSRALTSRGISLSLYVLIQLLLSAAGVLLLLRTMHLSPGGSGTRVLMCVIFAGGVFTSAALAVEPPKLSSLVTCFDVVVLFALILLLLGRFLELPALEPALWTCVAAIAASLGALIAGRVEREGSRASVRGSPAAGRALIAGVFALMAAAAALLTAFASGGVRSLSEAALAALKWCWGLVVSAAGFVLGLLERFIMWLSQFVNDDPAALGGMPAAPQMPGGDYEMEELTLPPWLGYAALALCAAVLVLLLLRLRRERTASRTVLRRRHTSVEMRQSGLSRALRELWSRLCRALRYRADCIRFRKTPAGLLAWCERRVPKSERRALSESGSQFLLRLSASASGAEQSAALKELSKLVERSFYSAHPCAVSPELYKTVRKCRFTAGASKVSRSFASGAAK